MSVDPAVCGGNGASLATNGHRAAALPDALTASAGAAQVAGAGGSLVGRGPGDADAGMVASPSRSVGSQSADDARLLDAVCRGVSRLAGASAAPPRRIRMTCGAATVDVEWPEADPGSAAGVPRTWGAEPATEAGLRYVTSPSVGTFYHAPEPGAPPFVSVGDLVRPGQAVGVLEVMKMMSTITADVGGRVVEVVVPDAHSVEYQQRLIVLDPGPDEGGDAPY